MVVSPTPFPVADPCSVEVIVQFLEIADSAEYRLAQIAQQADATPSDDLEPVIKEMQIIETEARNINAPPCALEAKSALTSYTEKLVTKTVWGGQGCVVAIRLRDKERRFY